MRCADTDNIVAPCYGLDAAAFQCHTWSLFFFFGREACLSLSAVGNRLFVNCENT